MIDQAPVVRDVAGISVVRDDLYPGGTKARFVRLLFEKPSIDEVIYASPAQGGAQVALAVTAKQAGKTATIFVAGRAEPHPRTNQARRLGAKIVEVRPGYLNVVNARAREYHARTPRTALAPFGMDMPEAVAVIAQAARMTGLKPDEVWCAGGSGVLCRGLALGFPTASMHVVQVGRELQPGDVDRATIHIPRVREFDKVPPASQRPPFPSDPHYDAKAWDSCVRGSRASLAAGKRVLFWNVLGNLE